MFLVGIANVRETVDDADDHQPPRTYASCAPLRFGS